jgi:hypothetical protein
LVNNYRYLEDRLVLVPVAVILVSMAEISWDFLASRFTIRPSQPTHCAGETVRVNTSSS